MNGDKRGCFVSLIPLNGGKVNGALDTVMGCAIVPTITSSKNNKHFFQVDFIFSSFCITSCYNMNPALYTF